MQVLHKNSYHQILIKPALCAAVILLASSCHAADQTKAPQDSAVLSTPPNEEPISQIHEGPSVTDQHNNARVRAQKLRDQSRARIEKRKAEAYTRRAAQQTTRDEARKLHNDFKSDLLAMLLEDGLIDKQDYPSEYDVKFTYISADIIMNDTNLSKRFEQRYEMLWKRYNRVISDPSYIVITPNSYEIRESPPSGGNYHYKAQFN
ncbi:MAG: hypothetical protein ABJG88_00935 [Litorimonas sp.]